MAADGTLTHGGRRLNKHLREIGYSVDLTDKRSLLPYTTNVLHCWTGPVGSGDRPPAKEELRRCRHWWVTELQIVRPAVLVLLGRVASEAFADLCRVDAKEQGLTVTFGDVSVRRFLLPHPSDRRDNSTLYREIFCRIGEMLSARSEGSASACH